jgi:hypothetical protein
MILIRLRYGFGETSHWDIKCEDEKVYNLVRLDIKSFMFQIK